MRALIAFAAAIGLSAAAAASGPPEADLLREAVAASGLSGEMLFARGGEVRLEWAMGAVPESRWRWASVTKQVAAVIAMQEVERGRLELDAPIARYLPAWRGPGAGVVTVRMLLRHTSGLPDPNDTETAYLPGAPENADITNRVCAGTPRDAPGASFRYNNCDYHVLGAILERVSGTGFAALVGERIARSTGTDIRLAPAGLPTSPGFVRGKPEMALDIAAFGAAGGLNGTARDLWHFDQALIDGRLLPRAARDAMWAGDPKQGYAAFGQWVFPATLKGCAGPVRLVERRGAIGGIAVRNFIAPEMNAVLILFTNRGDGGFGEVWQGKGLSFDLLSAALCGEKA